MTYEPPTHDDRGLRLSTAFDDLRDARRSADDKVVAGVLGGVAGHFRIDPILLRVTTVVLAIFGGVGVLLYAIAWLTMPREENPSLLDEARGRTSHRSPGAVPTAITLGIIAVLSLSNIITDSWDGTLLLLLTVAGLYLLLRRRDDERQGTSFEEHVAGSAWGPVPPGSAADRIPGADTIGSTAAASYANPAVRGSSEGWPEGPDWEPVGTSAWEPAGSAWNAGTGSPVPPDPFASDMVEPAVPRSRLTAITLSMAALAAAVVFVNDVTWAAVPPGGYVAAPLAVIGVGLLAGLRRRKAKGLIATGIILSVLLVPVTAIGEYVGSAETVSLSPTTLAEVDGLVVDQDAGETSVDLSNVPFTDGDTATVTIDQGLGLLTVTLPPEVDATIEYGGGLGDANLLGEHFEGAIDAQRITDLGADGAGGGTITLTVNLDAGELEVTR